MQGVGLATWSAVLHACGVSGVHVSRLIAIVSLLFTVSAEGILVEQSSTWKLKAIWMYTGLLAIRIKI